MEWNIQSRSHTCRECAEPFGDRQVLHTLLFSGAEGLERVDVCVRCWEGQYSEAANHRRGFVSHWQTVHLIPPPPTEVIQKESAETLLRKLLERNQREDDAACFVLAIMLERKRILKMQGKSRTDGQRRLHYEHAKSGDVLTVIEAELRLDQLEAVQKRVSDLLEQGLPEPAAAPPIAEGGQAEDDGAARPAEPEEQAPSSEAPEAGPSNDEVEERAAAGEAECDPSGADASRPAGAGDVS